MTGRGALLLATLVAFAASSARTARAADTVETWEVGATDLDYYVGYDGLALDDAVQGCIWSDIMLGYGLVEGLSAYVGLTFEADGQLADRAAQAYFGVFGTPLDSDHVDLDLFLDFAVGGPDDDALHVMPSLELNLDLEPDLQLAGLYVRSGLHLSGTQTHGPTSGGSSPGGPDAHVELAAGAYWTVAQGHQLLAELDGSYPVVSETEEGLEIGGLSLGYNVEVHRSLELISEVGVDVPEDDELLSGSVMLGLIATMAR